MAAAGALAFIASPESLASVPADALVLPLAPGLPVSRERLLASRPEDVLNEDDPKRIANEADAIASTWTQADQAWAWRGVDLAGCFTFGLRFAALDLIKTIRIVDACLGRAGDVTVVTDAPVAFDHFPPYPYLSALGPVLRTRAADRGFALRVLPSVPPAAAPKPSRLSKAYSIVVTRQGLEKLLEPECVVALGPYPDVYRPLAQVRGRASHPTVVVSPKAAPVRASSRNSLYFVTLEACVDRAARQEAEAFGRRALAALPPRPPANTATGEAEVLRPILQGHLRHLARENLPGMAILGEAFESVLGGIRGAVLVETVSPLGKAAVRFARRKHVQTTVIQHGVISGTFSYRETEGDRVAAWGPADAAWFRDNLGPATLVRETGSPRYDRLAGEDRRKEENLPTGWPQGKPVALYLSQPLVQDHALRSPWSRWNVLQMALSCTREDGPFRLVVKWHPSESPEPLPSPEADALARSLHRANTITLLTHASVVLAVSSTAALEAMYLDRPVVFLGPPDPGPFNPPEQGGGLRARDPPELADEVRDLLPGGARREATLSRQRDFLRRNYAPVDGRAAERVAELVREG